MRFIRSVISIHAPLAGSDGPGPDEQLHGVGISIHAPLAGSDPRADAETGDLTAISIHAPLAGSDYGVNVC